MIFYDARNVSPKERSHILARPPWRCSPEVSAKVRRIFDEAATEGKAALFRWSLELDGRAPSVLEVTPAVVDAARSRLNAEDIDAIEFAVDQVRFFHDATKPTPQTIETMPGASVRRVWRPIESCGVYVPAGSAPLLSTLIMLAEPARVAGVTERIVTTPPGIDVAPHPGMIAAAAACGLERLWLIGGAQAIAALTLGVFTPKAQKIFGPGNAYVAEAKRYAATLQDGPAIDLPAGPSELVVIADGAANPEFVAADLLSQAEHDADAQVMLLSTSAELIDAVEQALRRQLSDLPRSAIAARVMANARAVRVRSVEEAMEWANHYAPEHLSLQIADAERVLDQIEHAGAVFIGGCSAETFGDYVVGSSHVLPTDGAARLCSGVSVASFMKSFTIQHIDAEGVRRLAAPAARLARLEGLEAHARAADMRADAGRMPVMGGQRVARRRLGEVQRITRETSIDVAIDLDRTAPVSIATGFGFFDHMLEQVALHGGFSAKLSCSGDLEVDAHHTIEDCALALGEALRRALGERRGIGRFGFQLPMDDAEAHISLDLGGRPYLVFKADFAAPLLGAYPTEMTEHFFRSLAQTARATIHLRVTGENDHHKTEACFKALGRALRQAVRMDGDETPSTKGVIA